jgi:hypothetical protein
MNDTVVTLAHELAHSLGSKHDEDVRLFLHCKKRLLDFPVPSWKLFPGRESLVNDIPAGEGKIINFFTVYAVLCQTIEVHTMEQEQLKNTTFFLFFVVITALLCPVCLAFSSGQVEAMPLRSA